MYWYIAKSYLRFWLTLSFWHPHVVLLERWEEAKIAYNNLQSEKQQCTVSAVPPYSNLFSAPQAAEWCTFVVLVKRTAVNAWSTETSVISSCCTLISWGLLKHRCAILRILTRTHFHYIFNALRLISQCLVVCSKQCECVLTGCRDENLRLHVHVSRTMDVWIACRICIALLEGYTVWINSCPHPRAVEIRSLESVSPKTELLAAAANKTSYFQRGDISIPYLLLWECSLQVHLACRHSECCTWLQYPFLLLTGGVFDGIIISSRRELHHVSVWVL